MCETNRQLDAAIVQMAFGLIGKAIDASLANQIGDYQPKNSTSLLAAAMNAYEQGKITKSQLIAVITALDETTTSNINSLTRIINN